MTRGAISTTVALLLIALLIVASGPARGEDESDPVSARAYEVRYRSLSDAADLVGDLLSDEGALTLKPRLSTLVVEDRLSVLERVASVLASFDLPPQRVEVTVNLFLGLREEQSGHGSAGAAGSFSREVRGVIETLGDFTKWTSYEPLGSRSVIGVEGDPLVASISAEYIVAFTVESVHESGVIKFKRFSLQRVERGEDGREEIEDLYTAGMVVDAGDLTLLVAASGPDADRALFLALQAEPR
jgi:hypothetical protein